MERGKVLPSFGKEKYLYYKFGQVIILVEALLIELLKIHTIIHGLEPGSTLLLMRISLSRIERHSKIIISIMDIPEWMVKSSITILRKLL